MCPVAYSLIDDPYRAGCRPDAKASVGGATGRVEGNTSLFGVLAALFRVLCVLGNPHACNAHSPEKMASSISYRSRPRIFSSRVRFTSRFYFEGEKIEADAAADDHIAKFIGSVERSEKAFQRMLSRRKVRDIVNFYESAETQPAIPGSVLLFSEEILNFKPLGQFDSIGDLEDPKSGFLIIDGQHRLAGLHFFGAKNPSLLDQIEVPCVIFDGKTGDFAAEMFVIINSTQTRINRSHLVDLLDRISPYDDETRLAASSCANSTTRPLRRCSTRSIGWAGAAVRRSGFFRLNCSTRSRKIVVQNEKFFMKDFRAKPERAFELVADYLKAVRR